MRSRTACLTSLALLTAAPCHADFIGWTANVRPVTGGYLINVFAVTNDSGDVLLNRFGGTAGPSQGYITTNAAGGFRQGAGDQGTFAPISNQSWTTLDSFLTVGGALVGGTQWIGNGASIGDPEWLVSYTDSAAGGPVTVNAFSTPSNATGFTNPYLNAIPIDSGWYIAGASTPARSLASLTNRIANTSTAAAAGTHGMMVAQLYLADTSPQRTITWRMGASMRRPDGSLSQGLFEFTIPMCVTDGDGDGVLDCDDNCPSTPNAAQVDCNGNGIGDACESFTDCNGNSIPDSCDIASGQSLDCNSNGVPDTCDLSSGTSADIDANGVPDDCQTSTVPGQFATVQAAIDAAPASGMRIVQVAAGTYTGAIDFLGKRIVLRGAGATGTTLRVTPGLASASVLRLAGTPGGTAIENLAIRGGTGSPLVPGSSIIVGGGLYASGATATIRDVVFEDNTAQFGGGVYALNSNLTLERCTFRSNAASEDGGGFQSFGGTSSLTDCTLEDNTAGNRGGGMHVVGGAGHLLLRTDVLDNASSNDAGGLSWVPYGTTGTLTVRDCEVRLNTATDDQGGIGIVPDGTDGRISLQGTIACANSPRPNVDGPYTDLGGNTVCDCPSDLNQDGSVNGDDLGMLLSAWGKCATADCPADIIVDGEVNGMDLGALLNQWLGCN